jgi:hypothetical protein
MPKIIIGIMVLALCALSPQSAFAIKTHRSSPNGGFCNGKYVKDLSKCKPQTSQRRQGNTSPCRTSLDNRIDSRRQAAASAMHKIGYAMGEYMDTCKQVQKARNEAKAKEDPHRRSKK